MNIYKRKKSNQMKFKFLKSFLLLFFVVYQVGCSQQQNNGFSLVNLSHLDHLYEEVVIDSKPMAIIHIYAEYPDYNWVEAPGEGIACIDDVTRAAIVYLRHYKYTGQQASLDKAKKLLDFVLYMQASNGLFYNFIFSDLKINKTRDNSIPKADWWAWRSIWALGEGLDIFEKIDASYYNKLINSIQKTFPAIDSMLQNYPKNEISGKFLFPTWLPSGTASDQASVLMFALNSYYNSIQDTAIKRRMDWIGKGIIAMQAGDSLSAPHGAFLSWRNVWHAYGNSQATSLLMTGKTIENGNFISNGLVEVKYFYPYLIKNNYLNQFHAENKDDKFYITNITQFSQIAYGIRPMVWASLQAFQVSRDSVYAKQAGEIASWLLGQNISGRPMYDPHTGRCFDGIEDNEKINKNSGAESTIEALLILIEVENNPISKEVVFNYYNEK